jgi:flagellar hook-length control protein FliK
MGATSPAAATAPSVAANPTSTPGSDDQPAPATPATLAPAPVAPSNVAFAQPAVTDAIANTAPAEPTAPARHGSANTNPDYSSVAAAVPTASMPASTPLATTAAPVATRADGLSAQPGLAAAFATLRTAPNGAVSLNVALHPADLGAVQVHATFHDGTLNVTVACADDAARQAVTAALPDLREQLGHAAQIDVHIGDGALSQNSGGGQAPPDGQVVDYGQRGPTRSSGGDSHAPPDPSNSRRPDGGGDRGLDRWM